MCRRNQSATPRGRGGSGRALRIGAPLNSIVIISRISGYRSEILRSGSGLASGWPLCYPLPPGSSQQEKGRQRVRYRVW
jgi:hypothetical protein